MKRISKYFLLLIAIIFVHSAYAQDGDAVYNKIMKVYTLNDDGSSEYREYKEVKLLSHMSFHRLYGETFVVFDPEYQEVVINEAYTIMKDGKKVVVPENAFNEVLPRAARNAPPYNRLRELVITHTGLEVGATIYLDYTIKTGAGYMPTFMGEEMIRDIVPIREKKLIIRVPEGKELHYQVHNLRTAAEVSEEKGMKVYAFTFNGLSAYTNEWGIDEEGLPRLFFSAAKDLERAYFQFVAQPAFTYQASTDMIKASEKIRDENDDELRAVLAIQKMVVNDVGTWNLPLEYAGFSCRTPEETWQSNAGTALEKTVLLATLLQKAGFGAVPVAIIPKKYYNREIGSLYIFEDFAVQAKLSSGKMIYLSATHTSGQDLGISLKGKLFLLLDGAIESLKTFDPSTGEDGLKYNGEFTLDEENILHGTMNVKLVGSLNPYLSLYQDSAYMKRFASGVKEASLKSLAPEESKFELEIEIKNVLKQYGDYLFMDIFSSNAGISSWGFTYIEANRTAPIKLKERIFEHYNFSVELPEGYELISPETNTTIDNDIGKVSVSLQQKGNKILIDRNIILTKELIKYNEFEAFEALWDAWMNPANKRIILKHTE